jgi:hypothetical protein
MKLRIVRIFFVGALALFQWVVFAACPFTQAEPPAAARMIVVPKELPTAVLHNPDMGWVLYENYPLDQDPHGSSTLLQVPNENFAGVDSVAVMFSWQDVETLPDEYDFSKVDFAYDYWAPRGKAIQLRLSSETLLWWNNRNPPTGKGVPDYVLAKLSADEKQTRELQGVGYVVADARNAFYRERLKKFLLAINEHFSEKRPVTLIDLRGFGVWGEWHSGFKYASVEQRHDALTGIIDTWCDALPKHQLALSYSYDPDSPKTLYEGPTDKFDERSTTHYAEYLYYSAFDYALTKPNVTYRRDGCGGAVHSNERKLNEEAFRLGRGPLFSEFIDGYTQSKAAGPKWLEWKINDALSLHPNYMSLLGWQGGDSLSFVKEGAEWFNSGLVRMGYRLVPTRIVYPTSIAVDTPFTIETRWANRGAGRALRNYEQRLYLLAADGHVAATASGGPIQTSKWAEDGEHNVLAKVLFKNVPPGAYQIAIGLHDEKSGRDIELPLTGGGASGSYLVSNISVAADKPMPESVK